MEIDTAMTARFLAALTGDACFTFQTFPEGGAQGGKLKRVLHGPLVKHARLLESLNRQGAGVFVMVNRGDLAGRKAANVVAARALFVDLDGAPLDPVLSGPLAPRIVVESSPDKWHCYWPVADLPLGQFSRAQKALAAVFGGDPKVCDTPRVMRLPGFLHQKAGAVLTRLDQAEAGPYTWDEVSRAFGLATRMRLPDQIREGDRNTTLYQLARSAFAQGVPEAVQLAKALQVNERCTPPLSKVEVETIVRSAYQASSCGAFSVPLALVDSAAFKALDDKPKLLLLLAYRRANSFNEGLLTLPWSELSPWFSCKQETFYEYRKKALGSGLLIETVPPKRAAPKKGRGAKPTFYRLAIPPQKSTYLEPEIPPPTGGPEALQAPAL